MRAATGTTRRAAYFTENWKTFLRGCLSLSGLSLLKAGNIMVIIGLAKKPMRTTKLTATP